MNRLHWCAHIHKGIALIQPDENLSSAYQKKAESALDAMHSVTPKEWKITAGYYALYFSLYAALIRAGIRSENHICSLELMRTVLKEYFTPEDAETLELARRSRIDNQYYTTETASDDYLRELSGLVPHFLVKCKTIINRLTAKDIARIRNEYLALTSDDGQVRS